ncbi:MAG: hypothetical protein EAZ97_03790 [Bacteroidetes bacterium]|nr:MAG: hypothetical protein EAZ97_03790 [Bacteroidota bacterium]
MKTSNFKDWTLTTLDKTFDLCQILDYKCQILQDWQKLAATFEVSDFESQNLLNLQEPLQWGGKAWNETELENKFISPVIMLAKIDDRIVGYFLERPLKAVVKNYELSGIVDGMIATGFRDPDVPFFCMHEYKRSVDNHGNPDAQALAAMLVVRELNNNNKPIYGLYIVGLTWNFIVLNANEYCVSKDYKSDNEELFNIFKMLKALKHIIRTELM